MQGPYTQYAHTYAGRHLGHKYSTFLFGGETAYKSLFLDVATGYFDVKGWWHLFQDKARRDQLPVRLLLGSPPSDSVGHEDQLLSPFLTSHERSDWDKLEKFVEWLKQDYVKVRIVRTHHHGGAAKRFLHAKTFLLGQKARSGFPNDLLHRGIIGSANFTNAGMVSNIEAALFTRDFANVLKDHHQWFAAQWNEAVDYKQELIVLYEKALLLSSAREVFNKMLVEAVPYSKANNASDAVWLGKLKEHQRSAAKQLYSILEAYGGALLCDDVGLGKTYTAGALGKLVELTSDKNVVIVCPKSIKSSWTNYLETAGGFRPTVLTYDEVISKNKRHENWYQATDLLILDEAHVLRNPKAQRTILIKDAVQKTGCKVLLLTATPVNNGVNDLYGLLSLFLPDRALAKEGLYSLFGTFQSARANLKKEAASYETAMALVRVALSSVTVKRTRAFVRKQYNNDEELIFPQKVKPIKIDYHNTPEFQKFFRQFMYDFENDLLLSAYAPGQYLSELRAERPEDDLSSRVVAHLIKLTMLKKMESSLDAFEQVCRTVLTNTERRISEVTETNSGVLKAEDSYELSAFEDDDEENPEERTAEEKRKSASQENGSLKPLNLTRQEHYQHREQLKAYLAALNQDRVLLKKWKTAIKTLKEVPDPKFEELRGHLNELETVALAGPVERYNDCRKVLIFTSSLHTAQYLYRRLSKMVAKNSELEMVFGGMSSEQKEDILARFSPHTAVTKTDYRYDTPESEQIRILIATDVLAEGVNLQQAGSVINYDLTWNPMRMLQRVGRVDRMNSKHTVVQNFYFFPNSEDVDKYLGLVKILTAKIKTADATIGASDSSIKALIIPEAALDEKNYEYQAHFVQAQSKPDFSLDHFEEEIANSNQFDLLFEMREALSENDVLALKRQEIYGATTSAWLDDRSSFLVAVKNSLLESTKFYLIPAGNSASNALLLEDTDLHTSLVNVSSWLDFNATAKFRIKPEELSFVTRKMEAIKKRALQEWADEAEKVKIYAEGQKTKKADEARDSILARLVQIEATGDLTREQMSAEIEMIDSLDPLIDQEVLTSLSATVSKLELDQVFSHVASVVAKLKRRSSRYQSLSKLSQAPILDDLEIVGWLALSSNQVSSMKPPTT